MYKRLCSNDKTKALMNVVRFPTDQTIANNTIVKFREMNNCSNRLAFHLFPIGILVQLEYDRSQDLNGVINIDDDFLDALIVYGTESYQNELNERWQTHEEAIKKALIELPNLIDTSDLVKRKIDKTKYPEDIFSHIIEIIDDIRELHTKEEQMSWSVVRRAISENDYYYENYPKAVDYILFQCPEL